MRSRPYGIVGCIGLPSRTPIKIFDGPTLERLDTRFDYPEDRWYAIGLVEGRPVTVIYTVLNEPFRRIISAWKAEKHEQKAYFDYFEPED